MKSLKKLSHIALALSIGAFGIYEAKNTSKRRQKKFNDLKEYVHKLESQQDKFSRNISELEEKLKHQKEELAQAKEYTSESFDLIYQKIKEEEEKFSQKVNELYQNHDLLKTNLEELANALKEDNLSQDKKITLLNKYSAAVRIIINKENERIKELTKKDKNLVSLINEVSSKIENFRTSVLEASARMHEQENSERYQKIVAPTVRLSCHLEVGSGEIVYSQQENGEFKTYVFTALHVVGGAKEGRPIQISIFNNDSDVTTEFSGELIDYLDKLDLAVIELKSNEFFPAVQLASMEKIRNVQRFDDIYAVGCPLGYFPIQTEGEVTSQNKALAGENYWMISAETIFGNSGGGIFLKENNELIGILTRVSAYNNMINIAVPHMGIFVPGNKIYDWLDKSNLQFLYDPNISREECFRKREQEGQNRKGNGHQTPPIQDPTSVKNVLR